MNKSRKFTALIMAVAAAVTLGGGAAACSNGAEEDDRGIISGLPEENLPSFEAPPLYVGGDPAEEAPEEENPAEEAPPAPERPPEVTVPKINKATYVGVMGSNVSVRSGAGTSSGILGTAQNATRYAYLGKTGEWYKIYYKNRIAYISARYAEPVQMTASDEAKIEAVIAEGARLLGSPYVYGATRYHSGNGTLLSGFNVNEYDCSSLMQYIFKKGANVNLQVNTRTQVKQGVTVAKSELKRGDLMFFTNSSRVNNTGLERIGHVALYLGDGYMLHTANTRDNARIEKISPTWQGYFIQAQRML